MPKRILITGAGGYIGRQLSERLSKDYAVIGVDIRPTDDANHIQCDIRDPKLADILSEHQVSHVVHLASVLEASGDEQRDYDIDVNGTRNVVQCCLTQIDSHDELS